jgi:hypothetical protein
MAEKAKKSYTLHYGGKKFDLGDDDRGILDSYDGSSSGTIKVNLDNGNWLTLVIGPGIPIALTETPVHGAQVW